MAGSIFWKLRRMEPRRFSKVMDARNSAFDGARLVLLNAISKGCPSGTVKAVSWTSAAGRALEIRRIARIRVARFLRDMTPPWARKPRS
jgi:hypothetical protein